MWTSLSVNSLSRSSLCRCSRSRAIELIRSVIGLIRPYRGPSEVQPAFARRLGQGLDPAVEDVAAAIEHDVLDSLGGRALGDPLADLFRRLDVGAGLERAAHILLDRGGGRDRLAFAIVDDLRVDVLLRAEHGQTRTHARRGLDRPPATA